MLQNILRNLSPVVKNLLIINAIFFLAQNLIPGFTENLSLYFFQSTEFRAWQIVTHFFMHGSIGHIFFNMFALVMFGSNLERVLGAQRFLAFYFITAFGAAFLHQFVNWIEIAQLAKDYDSTIIEEVRLTGIEILNSGRNWSDPNLANLNYAYNTPVLGASGAVFGLLAAFAYYFPNTELFLMFIPFPIKAKYFVIGYAAMELFSGISNRPGDNVAHFAHLGGALFGILLVLFWKKNSNRFY